MTFIDWSDAEEMVGLLVEYVADEESDERAHRDRAKFLRDLSSALRVIASQTPDVPVEQTIASLRTIRESQSREFAADAALVHLDDCIEELERL